MKQNNLSRFDMIAFPLVGAVIAIWYVVLLVVISSVATDEIKENLIIPKAFGQIEPFELQLEQIRDPQECTRKVVQSSSAEIPFILKVFYDTTTDSAFQIKQQGSSFPITQRTNQVMTFYTNGTDQYEIYMEMNYPEAKNRQIYIEYLSGNQIVQSEQEKFNTKKFCMTIFANTKLPEKIPTREELFGDVYYHLDQIPAMVEGFNRNTITTASSISYMWLLIFGTVVMSVITLVGTFANSRGYRQKMNDMDDYMEMISEMPETLQKTAHTVTEPMNKIIEKLNAIASTPTIKKELEAKPKSSKFGSISKIIQKKETKEEPEINKPKNRGGLFSKFKKKDEPEIQLCEKCDEGKHCFAEYDYCECDCCYEDSNIKPQEESVKPEVSEPPAKQEIVKDYSDKEPTQNTKNDIHDETLEDVLKQTIPEKNPVTFVLNDETKKQHDKKVAETLEEGIERLAEDDEIKASVDEKEKQTLEQSNETSKKETEDDEIEEINLTDIEEEEEDSTKIIDDKKLEPQAGILQKAQPAHKKIDLSQFQDPQNAPKIARDVMDSVNIETKEGDFTNFTYEELNATYGWIQKYSEMLKETKNADLPLRETIIRDVIYNGIIKKFQERKYER